MGGHRMGMVESVRYRQGWRTAVVVLAVVGVLTAFVFIGLSTIVVAFLMGGIMVGSVHLSVGLAQERFLLRPEARTFLLIGVVGGFTTFSSFAFETFELLRDGQFLWAALNVVGQVTAGIVGLWAGYVASS